MSWLVNSEARSALRRAAMAAIGGAAVLTAVIPAGVAPVVSAAPRVPVALDPMSPDDPACATEGWNPACFGGMYDQVPDDGIPGDNAAEGGIPAPAMVPNVDGSMSPPGTPGAI
ncbi:hypothetical protein [Mycolicibacterium porcinum]|uniref:Intersectin-EH binding protein Ibp1 n=2 Tax=Mycolicibacterium porcinum TaxID=39693 RepID=A0AAW5T831_9MYCO|nr:hypothetical protein [Mycolicibacterium porcinum]MBX8686070.1 hypothetical protein [Mycobacterium sp. 20091114027_K0903767]MCV7391007.1 hypothetical protein [Mycolicibacterium porcinum]CDO29687.1 hypothetical protein BN979_02485 [Mycolicibacterium vulneris]